MTAKLRAWEPFFGAMSCTLGNAWDYLRRETLCGQYCSHSCCPLCNVCRWQHCVQSESHRWWSVFVHDSTFWCCHLFAMCAFGYAIFVSIICHLHVILSVSIYISCVCALYLTHCPAISSCGVRPWPQWTTFRKKKHCLEWGTRYLWIAYWPPAHVSSYA